MIDVIGKDYWEYPQGYTVATLLRDLQHLVDNNKDTDFGEVPVCLANDEYSCSGLRLEPFEGVVHLDIY